MAILNQVFYQLYHLIWHLMLRSRLNIKVQMLATFNSERLVIYPWRNWHQTPLLKAVTSKLDVWQPLSKKTAFAEHDNCSLKRVTWAYFFATPNRYRWIHDQKQKWITKRLPKVWDSKTVSFKSYHILKLSNMRNEQTFDTMRKEDSQTSNVSC